MKTSNRFEISLVLSAVLPALALAGGGGGGGGTTAPNSAEVRTLNERVPAGGTVQVKYLLTQPRPITSGGWEISTFDFAVNGIGITSPLGDAVGAGVVKNGKLTLSIVSPQSDYGTNLDYPFLTIAMEVPSSAAAGSTYTLDLANAVVQTTTGTLTFTDPKPGVLTVGGSVSVRGVYPGGGTYPAGTVITVRGNGFQPGTKISTKMKTTQPVYVSANEMRFTLTAAATLDEQPLQVTNPDGSQVVYYSYLRGVLVRPPSVAVLQATEPVFGATTHSTATFRSSACAAGQDLAIAIQNPNAWPVSVALTNASTGVTSTEVLASGARLTDTAASLTGAVGDVVVSSTSPVQFIGLCVDGGAFTVAAFSPEF